jgi:hypothetical protein
MRGFETVRKTRGDGGPDDSLKAKRSARMIGGMRRVL